MVMKGNSPSSSRIWNPHRDKMYYLDQLIIVNSELGMSGSLFCDKPWEISDLTYMLWSGHNDTSYKKIYEYDFLKWDKSVSDPGIIYKILWDVQTAGFYLLPQMMRLGGNKSLKVVGNEFEHPDLEETYQKQREKREGVYHGPKRFG